ncbi:MAG TPA: DNA mismatch repair protein MutS [Brumimicrobium sp.]|nr:DNA mismatch repair protein MutS [Brumimicrobium sp.]
MAKTKKEKSEETPLMRQYNGIKAKHPTAMLLFRVGDFYETFGEDAIKASRILGIILTKRKNGAASHIELAGFPHHSLQVYLPKLVRAGERVAICDQLEDPKLTKTIVKRGVTELVTPGVALNDQVLEQKKNNFLAAVHLGKKENGVAFLDISTGEFLIAQGNEEYIDKLMQGFEPSEVLYCRQQERKFKDTFGDRFYTFRQEDWIYSEDYGRESLNQHFNTKNLKGFGVEELTEGIIAAGAIMQYVSYTEHKQLGHITKISRIEEDKYVWLDRFTARNLELVFSPHENGATLLSVLDKTSTPMGGRMMKRWLVLPLKDLKAIENRLDAVQALIENDNIAFELGERLGGIYDLERLASKIAVGKVNPKEVNQLKNTLLEMQPIRALLKETKVNALVSIADRINPCEALTDLIIGQLHEDPAIQVGKGKVIADGYNAELDELRTLLATGRNYLEELQQREAENTGITSLKVGYNNVFGYFIEVRNTHKDKVPEDWVRKQTLVGSERYITEELKIYEEKILGAEGKIEILERQLFTELMLAMADYINPIQFNAFLIGQLDCFASFAKISKDNNYARPEMNDGFAIDIKEGRHPVIEQHLKLGEAYIPNDVFLDNETQQIIMITGPNMSGKSAILRQTALISIMSQIGCFVPAKSAKLGIVDKVFTRVGASDNISSGESTFMVEMNETASILNNLSPRSLVLLDEIGRGTSTYDGISIAWAIAEYIHQHPAAKCKTLFATHYHELNEMTNKFPRIKNYTVSVKEVGTKILFLRKLIEGGSEHSFGIHVAKLAGMPNAVVERATKMLKELEASNRGSDREKVKDAGNADNMQLSFFQLDDPVLENIREEVLSLDIDTLTPVEALFKLNEIKKMVGGK